MIRISVANTCIHSLVAASCVQKCSLSCSMLFECVVIEHCLSLRDEIIIISVPVC